MLVFSSFGCSANAIHLRYCEKVLRVGVFKYALHVVNFQVRSVLAAMEKNWS